jgi:GH15 family glucan-1,4-alpha-glucosidase
MWREPDNGIWELLEPVHWVSSKVMSWVVLDRSIRIADRVGRNSEAERWRPVREEIRRDVLSHGWSERANSFRQHYGSDEIDANLLLIPVMEFLPPDDPRVAATVGRIERELMIDGLVFRFCPRAAPGINTDLPLGAYEGAFLPATFWLATTYVKTGHPEKAEAILDRCERLAGLKGIFPEGFDPVSGEFRGNTPLLFSHVEYARARLLLSRYRAQRPA